MAYADVCVALNDIGVNSGDNEKKLPIIGKFLRSFIKLFIASTVIPLRPSTGSSIILIHKTPLTAGITKKGDIKRTRTIPLPGKVLLHEAAVAADADEVAAAARLQLVDGVAERRLEAWSDRSGLGCLEGETAHGGHARLVLERRVVLEAAGHAGVLVVEEEDADGGAAHGGV